MPRFLLLGAGFSRNWGGWLASEVTDDLVWRLRESQVIRELLLSSGFEEAFFQLQTRFKRDNNALGDLLALQSAILETFGAMNSAFAALDELNFTNDVAFSVIEFLARFDAIFTLNQDLLLELHYSPELANRARWAGIQWPGLLPPAGAWPARSAAARAELIAQRWRLAIGGEPHVDAGLQPIIKLHGSSNWYDGDGHDRAPVLVIGGQKREAIEASPLLTFYSQYFRDCLSQENALLMTIGYSFSDSHINEAICEANDRAMNFGLFIVEPKGRSILDKSDPDAMIQDLGGRLMSVNYVGGSSRLLTSTFHHDHLELAKLLRFFDE